MRALVCREYGPPEALVVVEMPDPVPGPGEVLIRAQAACVNYTDILSTGGRSQLARALPMVPGVEAAGVVAALGEGVSNVAIGDRVLCTVMHGAFAELVLAGTEEVVAVPPEMPIEEAAAFYIAGFTTWHGICHRARLQAGETLLVLGAGGGAGLAGVQMGKAIGARVVAAASSAEKLALAREAGADACLCYPSGPLDRDAQKKLTADLMALSRSDRAVTIGQINSVESGAGFDVVWDGVGGDYTEAAMRTLAWEGRYVSVGFAAGPPRIALAPLLFKNASLHGIQPSEPEYRLSARNRACIEQMFGWYAQGLLRPNVTELIPLDEAPRAFRLLLDRKALGRVIVAIP
jgi:NADPH2:quinone reductase